MWIDAHTHLEMLEGDTPQILDAAKNAGVTNMVTIGCHPNDFDKVLQISKKYYPTVAATLGVHPHEAKFYSHDVEKQIRASVNEDFVVGIGEIGLDYFYNHSDPVVQRPVFDAQMGLACDVKLPVEIHSRDAEDDTIAVLQNWKGKLTGMMHCFTGTERLARAALDVGFFISLSGVITFKNADELREIVKFVPLDRILVETDAPFLAPVPMRGKKNEPAFVTHTALKIAELKGLRPEKFSEAIHQNVRRLFPKWKI